jgi:hypothetical protein
MSSSSPVRPPQAGGQEVAKHERTGMKLLQLHRVTISQMCINSARHWRCRQGLLLHRSLPAACSIVHTALHYC